jgi:hypothetical protein
LTKNKRDGSNRYIKRILERNVQQFQASQNLPKAHNKDIETIAKKDPGMYEELQQRKRWTSANKDPKRALINQDQTA